MLSIIHHGEVPVVVITFHISLQASLSKVVGFTLVIRIIDNCKDAVNNNVNHPPI